MSCHKWERLLSEQLDGALDSRKAAMLADHLKSCPSCRRRSEEFRAVNAAFRTVPASDAPMGMARKAIAGWETQRRRPAGGFPAGLLSRPALALCATVLVTTYAGVALWPRPNAPTAPFTPSERQPSIATVIVPPSQEAADGPTEPAVTQVSATNGATALTDGGRAYFRPAVRTAEGRAAGDDMDFVNDDGAASESQWTRTQPDQTEAAEGRLLNAIRTGDDFVSNVAPQIRPLDGGGISAAMAAYEREANVVDTRLFRKISVGVKGQAFSDLCHKISDQTGIVLKANRSVADDKVTIFCDNAPLRDIMRQINHVFGFRWRRTGDTGAYEYELGQDLKDQLFEEDLRNKDRNQALIALDQEMDQYRRYLPLSVHEIMARAETASGEDKERLMRLAGAGRGPIVSYFQMSPAQMAALRAAPPAGGGLTEISVSDQALPENIARAALEGLPDLRIKKTGEGYVFALSPLSGGDPVASVVDAKPLVSLRLQEPELGRFALMGFSGVEVKDSGRLNRYITGEGIASSVSPSVHRPNNSTVNAYLAGDTTMRSLVTIKPEASCYLKPAVRWAEPDFNQGSAHRQIVRLAVGHPGTDPKVTTADVLEQVHKATGADIVADYYTRLYSPNEMTVRNASRYAMLNSLADTMGMRWKLESGWLQFRSVGFFNDRLKEVPNRLLARWQQSRQQHGTLTLDDMAEISRLSNAQLDSDEMSEGARAVYGLDEWPAVVNSLREHWRFLADLGPKLRAEAQSPSGVSFQEMDPTQQQRFVELAMGNNVDFLQLKPEDLAGSNLTVAFHPAPAEKNDRPSIQFTYHYTGPSHEPGAPVTRQVLTITPDMRTQGPDPADAETKQILETSKAASGVEGTLPD